jgi:hypothetical protein
MQIKVADDSFSTFFKLQFAIRLGTTTFAPEIEE